jgi:hypothetical protein
MGIYHYKFDVVNYATISNPAFIAHIDRVGILFYMKSEKKINNLPQKHDIH